MENIKMSEFSENYKNEFIQIKTFFGRDWKAEKMNSKMHKEFHKFPSEGRV